MPTYEYVCKSCDEHLEVVQSFTEDSLTVCPVCGGPLRKVFGNIGISFKGSGFYRTDSRPAATKKERDKETAAEKSAASGKDGSSAKDGSSGKDPAKKESASTGSSSDSSSSKSDSSSSKSDSSSSKPDSPSSKPGGSDKAGGSSDKARAAATPG